MFGVFGVLELVASVEGRSTVLMSMLDSVIGGVVSAKQTEKERSKSNRPMTSTK
jgi:hypothetical protein